MKATASITIPQPIGEVFSFITDVDNMPRWVSGVTGAHLTSGEMKRGARFVLDYITGWRPYEMELEVVEFAPPHIFASRTSRGPFVFEGRMELEERHDTTEITNIIEAGPDSLSTRIASALLGPLIARNFGKRLLRELEQLKAVITGGAAV